jgi:hypothetical protein
MFMDYFAFCIIFLEFVLHHTGEKSLICNILLVALSVHVTLPHTTAVTLLVVCPLEATPPVYGIQVCVHNHASSGLAHWATPPVLRIVRMLQELAS